MTVNIFAIKDTHTESAGRERARSMILSGKISVFFIEWAVPIDSKNINENFKGLAKGDAEPSLKVLAGLALSKGIKVISCDLSADQTIHELNSLNDGFGPYSIHSVFAHWGKAIRDKHAAEVIKTYITSNPHTQNGLVMFGSDHFIDHEDRGCPPLHKLIHSKVPAIDCYIINNHSGLYEQ